MENQKKIGKLVNWIKNNQDYSVKQLKQAVIKGGASEEDFEKALKVVNSQKAELEYQGVKARFLAFIIDAVIFGILFWLFLKIFSTTVVGGCDSGFYIGLTANKNGYETFNGLCGLSARLYIGLIFAYYVLLEWKLGATLGKLVKGIRVVKLTGKKIDLKASLIRNVMRVIDFLPFCYFVGALLVGFSETKQRVGDRLARTVVVSKNNAE